jgi:2-oxoisovalerate dehydrogenase E1 component alpha subunit
MKSQFSAGPATRTRSEEPRDPGRTPPLPSSEPISLVDRTGERVDGAPWPMPDAQTLTALLRAMVVGRRFDEQADALTRQGRLAVYPSSLGQEACQVGGVLALQERDWLFPTYRDSVAALTHGIDPVQVLTLLRGDWHSGYDPNAHRCAPQCTPLATNASHAVGLTYAARHRRGESGGRATTAALVLMGDGSTSEGEAHEAYNFAAMWNAPVVFLVQNNQWAISVPAARQSRAPTLAHKGVGYGIRGLYVDGNDAAAVHAAVSHALEEAKNGGGPTLIEARTYRMGPHTNSDAPDRYRDPGELEYWRLRDPIERLEALLRREDHLDDEMRRGFDEQAEALAESLRKRMARAPVMAPDSLFAHVYADAPASLREQAARVGAQGRGGRA